MSLRTRPVGPRGTALLAAAGVAGVLLAVHGWGTRSASPAGTALAGQPTATSPRTAGPQPSPSNSGAQATQGPAAHSPAAPGPMLASQSYAQYAFSVWPGTPSAAAKTAETGLIITVSRRTGGITVTAGVAGQSAGSPHFYSGGARVYVVEAALGDDSGGADYNLGDDGIVVTDSHGRILQ